MVKMWTNYQMKFKLKEIYKENECIYFFFLI